MSARASTPRRLAFFREPGVPRRYAVYAGPGAIADCIGYVQAVYIIRRGRLQASPWWQAYDFDGTPVSAPQQRREDAANRLDDRDQALDR